MELIAFEHHGAADSGPINLGDQVAVLEKLAAHPVQLGGRAVAGDLRKAGNKVSDLLEMSAEKDVKLTWSSKEPSGLK